MPHPRDAGTQGVEEVARKISDTASTRMAGQGVEVQTQAPQLRSAAKLWAEAEVPDDPTSLERLVNMGTRAPERVSSPARPPLVASQDMSS